ncbi:hypothetical protein B9Z19DRAFT_1080392 [Tuber borchii]|uniref:Uncharacterized protein n=1 Tax=Tuber borchii TaxID=42251 RepID=A0A2T6ZX27_TUBBO|nr:hypothetical protein B9Z19DRAFT_1080392 [Tuber borchii]
MLLKSLPVLILFLGHAHASALANPFPRVDSSHLDKRECIYNCKCRQGVAPGVYCGNCGVIEGCRQLGSACNFDVYQCGHNGNCCDYGPRDSCADRKGPCGKS